MLLDQFSRNVYRDSPKAFAFDELARSITHDAVKRDFDLQLPCHQAMMLLMVSMLRWRNTGRSASGSPPNRVGVRSVSSR